MEHNDWHGLVNKCWYQNCSSKCWSHLQLDWRYWLHWLWHPTVSLLNLALVFLIERLLYSWNVQNCCCVDVNTQLRYESKAPESGFPLRIVRIISEGYGNGFWKHIDWQHPISAEEESRFNCGMVRFQSASMVWMILYQIESSAGNIVVI